MDDKNEITCTSPFYIPSGSSVFSIQKIDSILKGETNSIKRFKIDLDQDGYADFELTSNIEHKCEYDGKQAYIYCLNDQSFINGKITSDTIYQNIKIDTTFFPSGAQKITINEIINCEKFFDNCTIYSITDALHPQFLNMGDTLSYYSDNWAYGYSELYKGPKFNFEPRCPECPFNEYHLAHFYSCNYSIPNDQILYLGLKKETTDKPILGWLKLSITDNYIMNIYELATQK